MNRIGLALSMLVVGAWIVLAIAFVRNDDPLARVALFLLTLYALAAIALVWIGVGFACLIRGYRRSAKRLSADERFVKPT